jgi:cell wall-associated NlpC family hydrolase
VAIARTWLGVPYAWGGASRAGTDCSGLVMAVYGRLGIHLAHYTGALWDEGRRVPPRDLRPGDLVFFDGLGHVGIYAGAGRYIHAPQTGEVVRVDRLAARPLDGAVRIAGT